MQYAHSVLIHKQRLGNRQFVINLQNLPYTNITNTIYIYFVGLVQTTILSQLTFAKGYAIGWYYISCMYLHSSTKSFYIHIHSNELDRNWALTKIIELVVTLNQHGANDLVYAWKKKKKKKHNLISILSKWYFEWHNLHIEWNWKKCNIIR